MNQIALSPMPTGNDDRMIFESQLESPSAELHFQHSMRSDEAAVEMTAFKFQK